MPHTVGTYIKATLGINANVHCSKKCHMRWVCPRTHMHAHTCCTCAHARTCTHMSDRCILCIIGIQAHLEHLKAPSQWAKDHAEDATSISIPSEKPRLFCLHGVQSVAPYRVSFRVGAGVSVDEGASASVGWGWVYLILHVSSPHQCSD